MPDTAFQSQSTLADRPLPKYQQAKESSYDLDWADLVTLDLSEYYLPGGRQTLANKLKDAVHNIGFFYITNFGLTQDVVDRQFAIGKEVFSLPMDEKLGYKADLEHGNYNGYRPLGAREHAPGLKDNVEMYNIFKFLPELEREHPSVIKDHRAEIESFQRHIAQDVVKKLLVLVAIVLELPEEALVEGHEYNDISDCALRYMIYRARSSEENAKFQDLYIKGHTDFGSLTLLFCQPIAALQVLTPAGEWKYVKPYPGSITVNIADVLQFWSNGYLKSSIHRVVAPPPDQAHLDRLGLLYFVRPSHDLTLKTLNSPLLRRLGLDTSEEDEKKKNGIKAGDWVRARVKKNFDPPDDKKESVVLGGVMAKVYD